MLIAYDTAWVFYNAFWRDKLILFSPFQHFPLIIIRSIA